MRQFVRNSYGNMCIFTAFLSLFLALVVSYSAGAVSNNKSVFISADNTFYGFVKGGESISASFTKTNQVELLGLAKQDITVTLEGPGIDAKNCVISKDVEVGKGCEFTTIVAPQTGVYRITFALPSAASLYTEVSPTVKWGGNLFSWDITIADGTSKKVGRVWSEQYAARQPVEEAYVTDLTYHYVSEDGYIYRADYKGYNGQISTFSADAVGVRANNNCVSAYQSVVVNDVKRSPSFGMCGGSYKVFFEQPAGDLPQTAKQWDGKTAWVSPSVTAPKVSDLKFESDKTGDAQSGKISFKLANFVGQYSVDIDTTGDGGFNSKEDVKIKRTLKSKTNDVQSVTFDGIDAAGQVVPATQPIRIRINVEKVAEIHLVNADVEGRTGGLQLTRLNGKNAPSTRMCWNDTELPELTNAALQTPDLDGRDCPDSSTAKLHGWPYATGSWGDSRYIDDYAYASTGIDGVAQIQYPEEGGAVVAGGQKKMLTTTTVIGAAAMTLLFLVLIGIFLIKRHRHAMLVKRATLPHPPVDTTGSGDPRPPAL